MDSDLRSIQQARTLLEQAAEAFQIYHMFDQAAVDTVVAAMIKAGVSQADRLATLAVSETGFGRVESKIEKNLFATRTLGERMEGMRTCGIINKTHGNSVWEIATPMGLIAALVPSTNPTSTALYKAIISAKARCSIVMSPHPRAAECTAEALKVVADAAYAAGAPEGLFGCMTEISLDGTNALLEDERTDLILATGGSAMVKSAYSKGKPAYGVGSGNVPVYVDRSADIEKAAKDIVYGSYFDHGTLCSTERSIVADAPIKNKLIEHLKKAGAFILDEDQKSKLRKYIQVDGRLNVDQVGRSPAYIAEKAGFSVPPKTRTLVAEVTSVGKDEPLSMETLSPILSLYERDGWEAGCEMCKSILSFGGLGHTLGIHAGNERIIEAFGLEKPAMRIVVNSVCALGSVGFTTQLFPAMTLGPGTIGGSITSDNISPMDLINIKRVAFETNPIHPGTKTIAGSLRYGAESAKRKTSQADRNDSPGWMDEIESRLRARAGSPGTSPRETKFVRSGKPVSQKRSAKFATNPDDHSNAAPDGPAGSNVASSVIVESTRATKSDNSYSLSADEIDALVDRFKKT